MITKDNTVKDTYHCDVCGSDVVWEGILPFAYTNFYAHMIPSYVNVVAKVKLIHNQDKDKLQISFKCPTCDNEIKFLYDF